MKKRYLDYPPEEREEIAILQINKSIKQFNDLPKHKRIEALSNCLKVELKIYEHKEDYHTCQMISDILKMINK
jgi:hypothetical protein